MELRCGIIGCGAIAEKHAEALKKGEGARLTCCFDRSSERASSFAAKWGIDAFVDAGGFFTAAPCEAVIVCTPSGSHLEPAVAAAKSGRHVICEKPIEVTTGRADQIIAACREAGVTLGGVFQRRFLPGAEVLKRAADSGRFGSIAVASASVKWWRSPEYYSQGAWRGTWELDGGGALMNQAIHTVDQLLWCAGEVESVSASAANRLHRGIEVEDTLVAQLRFKSGALGVIEASTACWPGHAQELSISGSGGSAILRDGRFAEFTFQQEEEGDTAVRSELGWSSEGQDGASDPMAISIEPFVRNHEEFASAVAGGRTPMTNAVECRRPIELIQAIYESSNSGETVRLP